MTDTPEVPEVLTVPEFAKSLRVSLRTVYRAVESGELKTVRLLGAIRIPVGERTRLFQEYAVSAPLPAAAADLSRRAQAVRDAWAKAQEDDLPQGFGWPGDLFDALEAL